MPRIPAVAERPTIPVWPDAGQLLGYRSKSSAYRGVRSGHIPTLSLAAHRVVVPTADLRQLLGLDPLGPTVEITGTGDAA